MKIYLLKHKGATQLFNFIAMCDTMKINKTEFYVGYTFFRKKDATTYLESKSYKENLEIITAELPKSKGDNRKKVIHI